MLFFAPPGREVLLTELAFECQQQSPWLQDLRIALPFGWLTPGESLSPSERQEVEPPAGTEGTVRCEILQGLPARMHISRGTQGRRSSCASTASIAVQDLVRAGREAVDRQETTSHNGRAANNALKLTLINPAPQA